MFGNPEAERAAIEATYEDVAAISRTKPKTGVNHITKVEPVVIYDEIICALSYSGADKSEQTRAQNKIEYDAVIFTAPKLDIMPGDKVMLERFGRIEKQCEHILNFSVVGRPVIYATHQEIKVKDGDLA